MKILKTASGKQTIKISRKEWELIGKKTGWVKKAQDYGDNNVNYESVKSLVSALNSQFGGMFEEGERGGYPWYSWEKTSESLSTAYINVSYTGRDDSIHLSKVYESEAMDERMGEQIKIENASQKIDSISDKIVNKVSEWVQK